MQTLIAIKTLVHAGKTIKAGQQFDAGSNASYYIDAGLAKEFTMLDETEAAEITTRKVGRPKKEDNYDTLE